MEAEVTLPPAHDSAGRARRFLRGALSDAGIDGDHAWSVLLVAHELVTNAVQHARTDFDLRLAVDGEEVHLVVRDENPRRPLLTPSPPLATSGRGLEIVSSLAEEWGVDADDVSKVVWAVVRRHHPDDDRTGRRSRPPGGLASDQSCLADPAAEHLSLSC